MWRRGGQQNGLATSARWKDGDPNGGGDGVVPAMKRRVVMEAVLVEEGWEGDNGGFQRVLRSSAAEKERAVASLEMKAVDDEVVGGLRQNRRRPGERWWWCSVLKARNGGWAPLDSTMRKIHNFFHFLFSDFFLFFDIFLLFLKKVDSDTKLMWDGSQLGSWLHRL